MTTQLPLSRATARQCATAVGIVALFALTGCGVASSNGDGSGAAPSPATTEQETESVDENGVVTLSDGQDTDAPGGSADVAATALDTAVAEVPDGQAISLDYTQDGTWEIVVLGGGTTQVTVSADGQTVTGTDDSVKSDYTDGSSAVRQTLAQAIHAAVRHTPGSIDEAHLVSDSQGVHWNVSIYPKGKTTPVTIKVHGRSGNILKN